MPLVRIDVSSTLNSKSVESIGEVIYQAMVNIANVPKNDKFQIVHRHNVDELTYPADGYLGVNYSSNIVFIQITWNAGRNIEVKKAFYKSVSEGINLKTGISQQDIWISLIDVKPEDWSFGNGEMQYSPKN